jgi:hypothetical protein
VLRKAQCIKPAKPLVSTTKVSISAKIFP